MVSSKLPDPYMIDFETAPLTDEEIKRLRPAREVFQDRGIPYPPTHRRRDHEIQYVVNLEPRVLEYFKAKGGDWQDHLNTALLEMIAEAEKKKAS